MFSAKWFILIAIIISNIYNIITWIMADKQRQKPLPEEVSDIYDKERYQKYLDYIADNKRLSFKYKIIEGVTDLVLIFSPIYSRIEALCNTNAYLIAIVTILLIFLISGIVHTFSSYEFTFKVEEKYGFNKKDGKEFVKDLLIEESMGLVTTGAIIMFLAFCFENMGSWTAGYTVGIEKSFIITTAIFAAFFVLFIGIQRISYVMLKKQYTFTPLEEGSLRDKIMEFQEGAKKKTDKIYVYNESKKSTSKNAFLLKIIGKREFGIADNFMDENDERELLAVLSHEVGHLKHKKNLMNYIKYVFIAGLYVFMALDINNPEIFLKLSNWIRSSFDITVNNYYLIVIVSLWIIRPVMWLFSIFNNYRMRWEEREADREAVKNGYGKELIDTFKRLSSDELVNVNPHPFIEFTEYSHPGMYQRIKAINEAIASMEKS